MAAVLKANFIHDDHWTDKNIALKLEAGNCMYNKTRRQM